MTTSKAAVAPSSTTLECCMCGDYGLSNELFGCNVCGFRSQHRYCSDLYPKEESYQVCNWCLTKKDGKSEGTQNFSLSPTNNNSNEGENNSPKKKSSSENHHVGLKVQRGNLQLQLNNPIKKQRSLELRSSSARKKIIASGCMEEALRRTKSEEMKNTTGITRQVFRGKVRRYKLLDEVSSLGRKMHI